MIAAVGIDPGQTGAMALMTDSGEVVVHDWSDIGALSAVLATWSMLWTVRLCALEKVTILPRDSKRSGATFMRHVGEIQAALKLSGLPWEEVYPQKWMKGLIPAKASARDKPSVGVVQRLYPQVNLLGPRGGVKDGRADAVLIARWALKTVQQREAEGAAK